MKIKNNFFNGLVGELDKIYFPTVKYYRDNTNCADTHYAVELFNNGCIDYDKLIERLSLRCNDSKEKVHSIVSNWIED